MADKDNKIILDLSRGEYADEFKKDECWQIDAYKECAEKLIEHLSELSLSEGKLRRMHDAIFIEGGRGVGKTAFMMNMKQFFDGYVKSDDLKVAGVSERDLVFLDLIDPTLLVDDENFSNVVIAEIHRVVSSHQGGYQLRENYTKALRELSEALENTESDDAYSSPGIARIQSYVKSNQLEQCFHAYVRECCAVLGCKAIVVRIDDVDMSLARAMDVMEVIRRFLSCPQLIPVVSGDASLYLDVLTSEFSESSLNHNSKKKVILTQSRARELGKRYFEKIFPWHLRICMRPIYRLRRKMYVRFDSAGRVIRLDHYIQLLDNLLWPMLNDEEGLKGTLLSNETTARQLVQRAKLFAPLIKEYLYKVEAGETSVQLTDRVQHEILSDQKELQRLQQLVLEGLHGESFYKLRLFAESYIRIIDIQENGRFLPLLPQLPITSVFENNKYSKENNYKFSAQFEKSILKSMERYEFSRDEVTPKSMVNFRLLKSIVESEEIPKASIYFPVPEMPVENLSHGNGLWSFSKELSELERNRVDFLREIYAPEQKYGSGNYKRRVISFGRAFEIICHGLIFDYPSISRGGLEEYIQSVIRRPSFNSSNDILYQVSYDPYEESDDDLISIDMGALSESVTKQIKKTADDLLKWQSKYIKESLIPRKSISMDLLYEVFCCFFDQINELRMRSGRLNDLGDIIRRTEYILVNSFARRVKPGSTGVIHQSIAINRAGKDKSLYRKEQLASDRSYNINVKPMVSEGSEEKYGWRADIIKAVMNHPLLNSDGIDITGSVKEGEVKANLSMTAKASGEIDVVKPNLLDNKKEIIEKVDFINIKYWLDDTLDMLPKIEGRVKIARLRTFMERLEREAQNGMTDAGVGLAVLQERYPDVYTKS